MFLAILMVRWGKYHVAMNNVVHMYNDLYIL